MKGILEYLKKTVLKFTADKEKRGLKVNRKSEGKRKRADKENIKGICENPRIQIMFVKMTLYSMSLGYCFNPLVIVWHSMHSRIQAQRHECILL